METKQNIDKETSIEQKTFFSFLKNPENGSLLKNDSNLNIYELTKLIERHRLIPFFFLNKKYLNDVLQEYVSKRFLENSQRMLIFANEVFQINNLLKKENLHPIFLKGPVLAYELHKDPSTRQMVDLDIYSNKSELQKTHKILLNLGYKPTEIPNTRFRKFILKDNYYFHPGKKVSIEIHYRFFPNRYLDNRFKTLFQNHTNILDIQNNQLQVLNTEANLIFLVLHGINHLWFRLFWLKDLADFITKKEINWNEVILHSKKLGIQNSLAQSIKLTSFIFGTDIPKEIEPFLTNKSTERFLFKNALKSIYSPINENLSTRLGRLIYLMKISKKPLFKFHTILGGILRFAGK